MPCIEVGVVLDRMPDREGIHPDFCDGASAEHVTI
jgi:hypothetical protein